MEPRCARASKNHKISFTNHHRAREHIEYCDRRHFFQRLKIIFRKTKSSCCISRRRVVREIETTVLGEGDARDNMSNNKCQ